MQKKSDYILGLDLGVNSVGWAVVDCASQPMRKAQASGDFCRPLARFDARIFQEMVDAKRASPKIKKGGKCAGCGEALRKPSGCGGD